jgi:ATP-dependent RNA helicase SUPV3L1/SUV3
VERRAGPPITTPLAPKAATEALTPHASGAVSDVDHVHPDAPSPVMIESEDAAAGGRLELTVPPDENIADETPSCPSPDNPLADSQADAGSQLDAGLADRGDAPDFPGDDAAPEAPAAALLVIESAAAADHLVTLRTAEFDQAGPVAEAAADPETTTPVLIEVWRPHRQQHHARRPGAGRASEPRERRQGPMAGDVAAGSETTRPEHRRENRRPRANGGGGGGGRGHGPEVDPESRAAADDGSGRTARPEAPRTRSKPRFEGQGDRRNGAPARSGEAERRHPRGGAETKPMDRPPDMNSPFAKLLALKASLEEKNKQGS